MGDAWWRISPAMGEQAARALIYGVGPEHFAERAMLAWARAGAGADDPAWRELATLPQRWSAPTFPFKAADLMARGVEKGPALGKALAAAEELWIAEGFPVDAGALAAIADAAARAADPDA
jgi:poly(A) polymerase